MSHIKRARVVKMLAIESTTFSFKKKSMPGVVRASEREKEGGGGREGWREAASEQEKRDAWKAITDKN